MQITLTPAPIKPATEQIIMAGNTQIGIAKTVHATNGVFSDYHVILNSKFVGGCYQGFGSTVDAAMRYAIEKNQRVRNEELLELNNLENVIWGDHELN